MQCGRPGFNPCDRKILWRRKWQPTPVFLPEDVFRPHVFPWTWGGKELDTTEGLHFHCIPDSFVEYEGYSISSKGFLPTVVDKMSSELNSPILVHFSLLIPKMLMFTFAICCLTTSSLPWFIPGSYARLLFTALDFTSITSHIHNWVLFLLWLCLLILSGVLSPLFSSSTLGLPAWGVHLAVSFLFAFSYCSWGSQEYWSGLLFPSPVDHVSRRFHNLFISLKITFCLCIYLANTNSRFNNKF